MPDTTFTDNDSSPANRIVADWLNMVNRFVNDAQDSDTALVGGALVAFADGNSYSAGSIARALQELRGTRTYTLYVSPSGSDSNDGLTDSTPLATLQAAINLFKVNCFLGGFRRIILAAGTYSSSAARTTRIGNDFMSRETVNGTALSVDGMIPANYLYIEGPNVGYDPATNPEPTPTAIFDGGGMTGYGLETRGPINVLIRNVKFKNYNGSVSSYGILNSGGQLRLENVHTENCNGVSSSRGFLEMCGGLLYGNTSKTFIGIRSIFLNHHGIGPAAITTGAPRIAFFNQGILAQENSTGHCDYCVIEDCTDGLRVLVNSRFNYTGVNFKRNTRAIRSSEGSITFATPGTVTWNHGTGDANQDLIVLQTGSRDISRDQYGHTPVAKDYTTATQTITGTTTNQDILTKTLARGEWAPTVSSVRKPQHIEFFACGTISGNAGVKQFKLRLGSSLIASISNDPADTGSWSCRGLIVFQGPTTQVANITWNGHTEAVRVNTGTATEDLKASDVDLIFQVQLANGADTIVVNHCHFTQVG